MKYSKIKLCSLIVALLLCGFITPTFSRAGFSETVYYLGYSDNLQSMASNNVEFAGYNISNGWSDFYQSYYGWYYSSLATDQAYLAWLYAPDGTITQTNAYYAWLSLVAATESAYYFYIYNHWTYWLEWSNYSYLGQYYTGLGTMYGAYGQ